MLRCWLSLHAHYYNMKLNGINGKGRGKLGSSVFAVNGGVQIVRLYSDTVRNPNTAAQQNTRARFKLVSQLSASLANVIAIRKVGLVSGRNKFTKINYGATSYSEGVAEVNLNSVKLTDSRISLGGFTADRSSGSAIAVELKQNNAQNVDKMVYVLVRKNEDQSLSVMDSQVVESAGTDGKFAGTLAYSDAPVVVYGYGLRVNTAEAAARFGNMIAPNAAQVAQLIVTSSEVASGTTLTDTMGLTMLEGETDGDSDDSANIVVNAIKSGNGSVTGGGRYSIGQTVTLVATPDAEASFVAWKAGSASGTTLSTSPTYQFVAENSVTICAVFEGGPVTRYTIGASVNPSGAGTVTGAGQYEEGATVTLVATPASGKRFVRWSEHGTVVSTSATYTFTAQSDRTLVATFEDAPAEQAAFSAVTANGTDILTGGTVTAQDSANISATVNPLGDATHVVLLQSTHAVGDTVSNVASYARELNGGSYSGSCRASEGTGTYKVAAGHISGTSFTIDALSGGTVNMNWE